MYLTDPPYNVNYEGGSGLKIQNDNMEDEKFRAFLRDAFQRAHNNMNKGSAFYIWHADSEGLNFRAAAKEAGLSVRQCLIWVKSSIVMGRQDYQWKHEPCLYGWKEGEAHRWNGGRKERTTITGYDIYEIKKMKKEDIIKFVEHIWCDKEEVETSIIYEKKPSVSGEHPTMKPLKLLARQIKNNSKENEIIYDGFGGSGSTLMSSEQLNRICYMMELDEKYVDVIVNRYINFKESDEDVFLIRNGEKLPYKEVVNMDGEE